MSEASEPALCPDCRSAATRVYTTPNLRNTPPGVAEARAREEKSGHEPDVIRRPVADGHDAQPKLSQGRGRPWQIEH